MTTGEIQTGLRSKSIASVLLLSFFWAAINLRPDLLPGLLPGSLPYFATHALPLFLFSAIAFLFARLQRTRSAPSPRTRAQTTSAMLIGLALFVLPAIVSWFTRGIEPNSARTALFCLVPVFTAVFQPYLGTARAANNHVILAALLAFFGALCILPIDYPRSPQAMLAFAALVLVVAGVGAANCLAEAAVNPTTPVPFSSIAAVAALTAALTLTAASALFDREQWMAISQYNRQPSFAATAVSFVPALMWVILADLPALLLLFWSMKRLSAVRLSTRYLLAPLLTILVGVAFLQLQGAIRPRTWLGLLLMASGTAYILFAPDSQSTPAPGAGTLFPSNRPSPDPE
jgi:drug/metabolite transporter (DMT)-like permease